MTECRLLHDSRLALRLPCEAWRLVRGQLLFGEDAMIGTGAHEDVEPVASMTERPVQVLTTTMRIHKLVVDRPAVVAYFRHISADKQEIALVHALEVGVKELAARRERFKTPA